MLGGGLLTLFFAFCFGVGVFWLCVAAVKKYGPRHWTNKSPNFVHEKQEKVPP